MKEFLKKYTEIRSCNNKSKFDSVDLKLSKLISSKSDRFEYLINIENWNLKKLNLQKEL